MEFCFILIVEVDAEGSHRHLEIRTDIGPMHEPNFSCPRILDLGRKIAKIRHCEVARVHFFWKRSDKLLRLSRLAQHVVVQEEHADFGVLWNSIAFALVLHGVPQLRNDIAIEIRIGLDMFLKICRQSSLNERTNPFVRSNDYIWRITNRVRLEKIQRVRIKALGVGLNEFQFDSRVRAGGLQKIVQLICGHDDVAGPHWS